MKINLTFEDVQGCLLSSTWDNEKHDRLPSHEMPQMLKNNGIIYIGGHFIGGDVGLCLGNAEERWIIRITDSSIDYRYDTDLLGSVSQNTITKLHDMLILCNHIGSVREQLSQMKFEYQKQEDPRITDGSAVEFKKSAVIDLTGGLKNGGDSNE